MVVTRIATCACGALTATCEGEPPVVSLCSCRECQRRTGSAFGLSAFYPRRAVTIDGERHDFARTSDDGFVLTFHFCPVCGTSVFWENTRMSDVVAVGVGGFADPTFPMPVRTVYDEHRHPWIGFEAASRL